jgi:hypothetical protein
VTNDLNGLQNLMSLSHQEYDKQKPGEKPCKTTKFIDDRPTRLFIVFYFPAAPKKLRGNAALKPIAAGIRKLLIPAPKS